MWPDRVSSPEPLALESDTYPTTLRGPAGTCNKLHCYGIEWNIVKGIIFYPSYHGILQKELAPR